MVTLTRPEGSHPEDFHLSRRGVAAVFFAGLRFVVALAI